MKWVRPLLAAAILTGTMVVASADSLTIGTPAPALAVAKWVKGVPVSFQKGNVYVVEFWATWCGPCMQSIPHLSELAEKYSGKATFTGVSVWERQSSPTDSSYFEKVDKFVKGGVPKMDYHVAVDGLDHTMATTWMRNAGEGGIPTAFIVNREGNIAWIGHPMAGLDEALSHVIDGTYNLSAALEARTKMKNEEAARTALLKPVQDALRAKDWPKAVAAIDEVVKAQPSFEMMLGYAKFVALLRSDEPTGYEYAKRLAGGSFKHNPELLNELAWGIAGGDLPLKTPDYRLAISIAKSAVQASSPKDANIIDTLAAAQFKAGDIDDAIATEAQAIAVASITKGFNPAGLADMKARLDSYKAKKDN